MADIKVQQIVVSANSADTTLSAPSDFDEVGSLDNAFILMASNTRGCVSTTTGNSEADDNGVNVYFTATDGITIDRPGSPGLSADIRFYIIEYTGSAGGPNEFLVRHRGSLTPSAGTSAQTTTISTTPTNIDDCVPFYSIMSTDTGNGWTNMTCALWCSSTATLNYHRGGAAGTTTVRVEVVEFTGSNWSVGHGDSGNVSADTGSITLNTAAAGTGGSTYNVNDWAEAFIWHTFKTDDNSDTNEAIADCAAVYDPGTGTSVVDWSFDTNHDSAGTNRHFVHVVENADMAVTRFTSTANAAGESTIDITSAGLTALGTACVIGSSESSGGGTAYARGMRLYYLNSTTQAAHWCGRSGNNMNHNLQVIDFEGVVGTSAGEVTDDASLRIAVRGEVTDDASLAVQTDPIRLVESSNITDDANTTRQLTIPGGKVGGDFDGGKITDVSNPGTGVDPTADGFLEAEISLEVTGHAVLGTSYIIDVYINGQLVTDADPPTITVAEEGEVTDDASVRIAIASEVTGAGSLRAALAGEVVDDGSARIAIASEVTGDASARVALRGEVTADGSARIATGQAGEVTDDASARIALPGDVTSAGSARFALPSEVTDDGSVRIAIAGDVTSPGSSRIAVQGDVAVDGSSRVALTAEVTDDGSLRVALPSEVVVTASGRIAAVGEVVQDGSARIAIAGEVLEDVSVRIQQNGQTVGTGSARFALRGESTVDASLRAALAGEVTAAGSARIEANLPGEVTDDASARIALPGDVAATGSVRVALSADVTGLASLRVALAGESVSLATARVALPSEVTGDGTIRVSVLGAATAPASLRAALSSEVSSDGSVRVAIASTVSAASSARIENVDTGQVTDDGSVRVAVRGQVTVDVSARMALRGENAFAGSLTAASPGGVSSVGSARVRQRGEETAAATSRILAAGIVTSAGSVRIRVGPIQRPEGRLTVSIPEPRALIVDPSRRTVHIQGNRELVVDPSRRHIHFAADRELE